MKICPLCEQGLIKEVIIKSTNEKVYICEECEALWLNDSANSMQVLSFNDFMKTRKLQPVWEELIIVKTL